MVDLSEYKEMPANHRPMADFITEVSESLEQAKDQTPKQIAEEFLWVVSTIQIQSLDLVWAEAPQKEILAFYEMTQPFWDRYQELTNRPHPEGKKQHYEPALLVGCTNLADPKKRSVKESLEAQGYDVIPYI